MVLLSYEGSYNSTEHDALPENILIRPDLPIVVTVYYSADMKLSMDGNVFQECSGEHEMCIVDLSPRDAAFRAAEMCGFNPDGLLVVLAWNYSVSGLVWTILPGNGVGLDEQALADVDVTGLAEPRCR